MEFRKRVFVFFVLGSRILDQALAAAAPEHEAFARGATSPGSVISNVASSIDLSLPTDTGCVVNICGGTYADAQIDNMLKQLRYAQEQLNKLKRHNAKGSETTSAPTTNSTTNQDVKTQTSLQELRDKLIQLRDQLIKENATKAETKAFDKGLEHSDSSAQTTNAANFPQLSTVVGDGISNFEVMTKGQYPLFSQLQSGDQTLYASTKWAEANDEERYLAYGKSKPTPHIKFTCLATVYAMIEHARGNSNFRVGPITYKDFNDDGFGAGAQPIRGVSNTHQITVINVPIQFQYLKDHGPIIFKVRIAGATEDHFILAIGMQRDGMLIANDPLSGSQVHIDPSRKIVVENGWNVTEMRFVEF